MTGRGSAGSVSFFYVVMISGVGIEIVETKRFTRYSDKSDIRLSKFFTFDELEYCFKKRNPNNSLAGRFAAKEATIKPLSNQGANYR